MSNILNKVKKLLNLSKSSNPNEAATAYALAQKLITEHQLTMSEVSSESEFIQGQIPVTGKNVIIWQSHLISGLCKINNCEALVSKRTTGIVFLILGKEDNIQIIQWFYNMIRAQIEVFCAEAMMVNRGGGKTFANQFKLGAVETVLKRLKESRGEAEQQYVAEHGGSAMIHISTEMANLAKWVNKEFRVGKAGPGHAIQGNASARELGKQAGHKVQLHRGHLK